MASCKRDVDHQESISTPTTCPKDTFFLFQIIEAGETNKNGYPVTLLILNQSDYSVVFPAGYGLKLFVEEGEGWRELKYKFRFAEGPHGLKNKGYKSIRFTHTGLSLCSRIKRKKSIDVFTLLTRCLYTCSVSSASMDGRVVLTTGLSGEKFLAGAVIVGVIVCTVTL